MALEAGRWSRTWALILVAGVLGASACGASGSPSVSPLDTATPGSTAATGSTAAAGLTGSTGSAAPTSAQKTSGTSPGTTTPSPPPPVATASAPQGSPAAIPSTGRLTGIPIYWVGETARSFRLYREFRTVPDVGGRIASAVAAMTRLNPLDPDYLTPWSPASRVTVRQAGTALTVDLSADALANRNVGSELAGRAVQQLVHTATAAAVPAQIRSVTITIDGRPADAWGAIRLGGPMTREPQTAVLSHAWVVTPQEGDRLTAGTVRFTGYGTSFEANFGWTVIDANGTVVARGWAVGGTGTGGFGEVRFSTTLGPGAYVVELRTDDPSAGEGPGPMTDTKRFSVG